MEMRPRLLAILFAAAAVVVLGMQVQEWVARARLSNRNLEFGEREFFDAVARGDAEAVALYLTAGIDPDVMDASRRTGLMHAAKRNDLATARAMLDGGADLNYRGKPFIGIPFLSNEPPRTDGVPLGIAAVEGHLDMVLLLIERGALEHKDNASMALSNAVQFGRDRVVDALTRAGVAPGTFRTWEVQRAGPSWELVDAVTNGRTEIVRALLSRSSRIDEPVRDGFNVLAIAAWKGHGPVVETLLAAGADPKRLGRWELAALVVAARSGRDAGVRAILAAQRAAPAANTALAACVAPNGASTHALLESIGVPASEARDLAVGAAASRGDLDALRQLIAAGAALDVRDWDGGTALEAAAITGHVEIVRELIAAGAPTHVMRGKWLHIAGGPGNAGYEEIRAMMQDGPPAAPAAQPGVVRGPPAPAAAQLDPIQIVNRAMDGDTRQANTLRAAQLMSDTNPVSALVDAAGSKDPRSVQRELSKGTAVDGIDDRGVTALMHAVAFDNLETAKVLLAAGANADARGATYQTTALMFAARSGNAELAKVLLDAGADPNSKDVRDLTALKMARDHGSLADGIVARARYAEVFELLLAAGAKDEPRPR
jgi:uncharacterized protein